MMPRRALRVLLALLALGFAALVGLAAPSEAASPYSYYAERQRGDTLIIKHNPAPGIVVGRISRRHVKPHRRVAHRVVKRRHVHRVRNVANPAIAGFCRDGGTRLRRDPQGRPLVVQREVCDSVAWYSRDPGDLIIRPAKDRFGLDEDVRPVIVRSGPGTPRVRGNPTAVIFTTTPRGSIFP